MAQASGLKHGAVQDKLFLPGLQQARHAAPRRLLRPHAVAARSSSATGCSRATCSRSSGRRWNYRKEDGGGMILDMMCHWRYVLDNLFGEVQSVSCLGATHIPKRWDEDGKPYAATADDAAYATVQLKGHGGEPVIAQINMSWATRVRRDDLVTFHVDGTHGSAVAGLHRLPRAVARRDAAAGVEPRREADDELLRPVAGVPDTRSTTTASRSSGSTSSATSSRTRPTSGRSRKAPRACSWSRRRSRAGRSGAGSTCRRSRSEGEPWPACRSRCRLPTAIAGSSATPCAARRVAARPRERGRSRASPTRPRTSSPTRCAAVDPWLDAAIDWDATIAYRQRLWSLGLGVAEAMDTAQRGMGLDWPTSLELIRRSLDAARDHPGALVASGCGTDHLAFDASDDDRRRHPRLRRADGGDRGARRHGSS